MLSIEMLMSLGTHDVCCASPNAVGQSLGFPRPWLQTMAVSVTRPHPTMNGVRIRMVVPLSSRRCAGDAEAVQHAVERAQIHAAVGNGKAGKVVERGDLIAARPELSPSLPIQGIDRRVAGIRNPPFGVRIEPAANP